MKSPPNPTLHIAKPLFSMQTLPININSTYREYILFLYTFVEYYLYHENSFTKN